MHRLTFTGRTGQFLKMIAKSSETSGGPSFTEIRWRIMKINGFQRIFPAPNQPTLPSFLPNGGMASHVECEALLSLSSVFCPREVEGAGERRVGLDEDNDNES